MDPGPGPSGSPPAGPLQPASADRVNQCRESSVHEKISQFNSLSTGMAGLQLGRGSFDAALSRAMVGREEAEAQVRRLHDETKQLQSALQDGRERERRVGERLEAVMVGCTPCPLAADVLPHLSPRLTFTTASQENYGRAKETHAHTQALWEKELRRARKDNFKNQSMIVKLREELKSARGDVKAMQERIEHEKSRTRAREQEAFSARYELVSVQEELQMALGRIKALEQERDAFKTAAQKEEVARIAAEGRIPLPQTDDISDEFSSPRKGAKAAARVRIASDTRLSLTTMDILSSAAAEMEREELTMQMLWERQRADRAQEMVDFLEAECRMRCCPSSRSEASRLDISPRPEGGPDSPQEQELAKATAAVAAAASAAAVEAHHHQEPPHVETHPQAHTEPSRPAAEARRKSRRSTIFCPDEGIFRTVSEPLEEAEDAESGELDEMSIQRADEQDVQLHLGPEPGRGIGTEARPSPFRLHARTPSVDPPNCAILARERTSLQSLLNAPHDNETDSLSSMCNVPTVDDTEAAPSPRPHTSAAVYLVTAATTTTTVPLRDEDDRTESSLGDRLRTPSSHAHPAGFDFTDPALTPTMTREQALAKIRERRGRVRSAAPTVATPHRAGKGSDKRAVSGPTNKPVGRSRT